jgi:2-dehydro-3-deoxygalactonokinase
MRILTIDMGTSNTRSGLWQDGVLLAEAASPVGVRDAALTGSKDVLRQALRDTIVRVLAAARVTESDVALAVASGMITSNAGLHEVPHRLAPAGLQELAAGMVRADQPDLFAGPLWFVPGVRNRDGQVNLHNHESMDMVRGEETEIMGLHRRLQLRERAMFILPGSHTKLLSVDEDGRILGCATTIAGELLQAISEHTLVKQSVDGFGKVLHAEQVRAGAATARKVGLARACFSVRILAMFSEVETDERASFLLGAVLADDLLALKNSSAIQMRPDTTIVICGKPMLRDALALLLEEQDFFYGKRIVVDDATQANLAGAGALALVSARF